MSLSIEGTTCHSVLQRMKECGFDFSRLHPIEFYAVFRCEDTARGLTQRFTGEFSHAWVDGRDDGSWELQVSRVMYATPEDIQGFEQRLGTLVEPLGGEMDGWGVSLEVPVALKAG